MRVLEWIINRCEGSANAVATPVGLVPTYEDLNWAAIDFSKAEFETVSRLNKDEWIKELASHKALFDKLGERMPQALINHADEILAQIQAM